MKRTFFSIIATLALGLTLGLSASCSKSKDTEPTGNKTVKYELTGNYTGRVFVAFTDQNGGTVSETVTSLPWAKELSIPNSVISVGFGGQTAAPNYGVSGQTITSKIYIGNQQKQSGTATADANGAIVLSNLATALN